ncbi:hypothetical protein ACWEOW_11230 [Monashia sp. NPDC004114]
MATITPVPFSLASALLNVATDNYEKGVSNVLFTPSYSQLTWQGLTPDAVYTDASNPTWTLQFDYAQDWTTANSLSQYLLTNAGTQKVVVFKPNGATTGKPIFTATVLIVAGPIGGAANTLLTGTVTMQVIGQPVKTTAP